MQAQTIFITGAAAGIGLQTARLFHARGWQLGVYDVDAAGIERLKAELGERVIGAALDVRDATAFAGALRDFHARYGRLDLLFNNAGVLAVGDFESIAAERHQAIIDINVKGVLQGCLAALPYLRQTTGSRVINMASASAIYGTPGFASYSASKFAVKGLSEALDIEWARHGIRVMDVMPLFVATHMVSGLASTPDSVRRLGVRLKAEDIARTVWDAAHWRLWRRVHWYPGLQTRLLALANKLAPALANRITIRKISGY
ncbi:NADP-dependent 3-hydroxy acid dehydrogenase YdfG [Solimonas aquatica]|uniref:NADP-dependent 3-hydroxy acid dehydrogenase YdfG n=1 Tax=Solimonas aquatica TaxID=489703 RepID=A0A1H9HZ90_9GAMM|nr:SDR family oxidoreductase [Solimonas aquatica]SEQ67512.1 NADP-dependent 3-hydroxy acid dehydrogenase YdfG [Solimonas aquatica]